MLPGAILRYLLGCTSLQHEEQVLQYCHRPNQLLGEHLVGCGEYYHSFGFGDIEQTREEGLLLELNRPWVSRRISLSQPIPDSSDPFPDPLGGRSCESSRIFLPRLPHVLGRAQDCSTRPI